MVGAIVHVRNEQSMRAVVRFRLISFHFPHGKSKVAKVSDHELDVWGVVDCSRSEGIIRMNQVLNEASRFEIVPRWYVRQSITVVLSSDSFS